MILADLTSSKVAAEGDAWAKRGKNNWGGGGKVARGSGQGKCGRVSVWTVRKHQSKSMSLPAHEGRQRITQLNLFVFEINPELRVTSHPLLLCGAAGRL